MVCPGGIDQLSVDISRLSVDISRLSVDISRLSVDISRLSVDISPLYVDMRPLAMDVRPLWIDVRSALVGPSFRLWSRILSAGADALHLTAACQIASRECRVTWWLVT